jgi:hypothetical protein
VLRFDPPTFKQFSTDPRTLANTKGVLFFFFKKKREGIPLDVVGWLCHIFCWTLFVCGCFLLINDLGGGGEKEYDNPNG